MERNDFLDGAEADPEIPRVPPFNGPVGFDGDINPDGTRIGLPFRRQVEPTRGPVEYFYNEGEPVPGPPSPAGADEFTSIYRFSITISDASVARDISVNAQGNNWAIEGFRVIENIPPNPDTGAPGHILWAPDPAPDGEMPAGSSTMTIRVIPGPATQLVLCAACILAGTRRRRA